MVLSSNPPFLVSIILSHLLTIHESLVPQIYTPSDCFNSTGGHPEITPVLGWITTPPLGYPWAPASPGVHAHLPTRRELATLGFDYLAGP